jgi:transcriptional regulator with XRE-family HTH domain
MNAPFHLRQSDLLARMEPDELRSVMRKLGCRTQQSLGDRIGVVRSTVGGWLCGKCAVPRHIAMLLRLLGAA